MTADPPPLHRSARVLLLWLAEGDGDARVTLSVADADGHRPAPWSGRLRFDPVRAVDEVRALLRGARRAVLRGGAREREALAAHGRLLFDLLLPPPVKDTLRAAAGGSLTVVAGGAAGRWTRPPCRGRSCTTGGRSSAWPGPSAS